MSIDNVRPNLKFEVNFEDDPLPAHPAYLESTAPIGFWRMEAVSGTTEQDQTVNNRDLTYINAPTLLEPSSRLTTYGDLNPSVSFNGTDEYAETAAASVWQNLSAEWSLSAWIYPTASRVADSIDFSGIVNCEGSATDRVPFFLHYGEYNFAGGVAPAGGVWAGYYVNGGSLGGYGNSALDPVVPTLNSWYHYVATFDGSQVALYRNGELVDTTAIVNANGAAAGTRKLQVGNATGANAASSRPFFPGRIDEVAVWDRVLSATEARNIYRYNAIGTVDEGNYIDLTASLDSTSNRVRSSPIRRGRSDSVSRVEAGTGTVILGNRDGKLSPDPVVNLLANPSAEVQTTGLPFTVEAGTLAYDTTHVRSGFRAFKLTATASPPAYATTQRDGLVGMRPGKTYTFSAYLYVPTGTTLANVRIEIVDEIAGSQEIQSTASPAALDAFHRLEVTKTIRSAADAAYVRVRLNEASDAIWFDDVQLEEASAATTYCDGDQTDCSWGGEAHTSLSHRKQASAPARKIGMPMRRFRLTANWDSVDYGLLHGYVERWDWAFPSQGKDAYVTARLTDGTRVLANTSMRGFSRSSERVGDRLRAILAFAGIGEDDISILDEEIDALALSAQTAVADDRTALAMIREIEETERGVFFVSKDGLFTYQGVLHRSIEGREDLVITDTTDGTDQARYSDIGISTDVSTVVNDVKIDNIAGTDHTFVYPLSQQRYFTVSAAESSLWQTDTADDVDRSVPLPYVDGLEVRPYRDPANLWPAILGVELGALVRIERTHQGIDVLNGTMHFLEGIEHDITPGNWSTRLRTAPTVRAPISADPWQTSVTKPIVLTSKTAAATGGTITMPSATFTAGRLYLIFANLWANGGTAPVAPGFTATNTFTNIRGDTGLSTKSWRHATYRSVASSTVTEAIQLTFAGQSADLVYDIVILEIVTGFNVATPVQDNNTSTVVTAFASYIDVGTLTDAESVVLGGYWKDANVDHNWSGAVELYQRNVGLNISYSVAYGFPPGVDRIDISWGQANGYHGTGFEVQAS